MKCLELAITYFEKFLSQIYVSRKQLYNIAMCCMFVAIKFCETKVFHLDDLYRCSHEDCTLPDAKKLCRLELLVLETLEWRLNAPTTVEYLTLYANYLGIDGAQLDDALEYAELAIRSKFCHMPTPRQQGLVCSTVPTSLVFSRNQVNGAKISHHPKYLQRC